jgi:BirA family transcriptional regulator, biotin operon repressor / biotin---[acetyl-CoA-carboxylase] ligase
VETQDFSMTRLDAVGSTNDYVKERIRGKELSGSGVVSAERQTAGRGRGANAWHSENDKGLWATLYFTGVRWDSFEAVMRASLSVVRALRESGLDTAIKWPNDVTAGRKKICGILAEKFDENLLIGVGVNLRQAAADFPEEIRDSATSLFLETNRRIENRGFLEKMLAHFCGLENAEENFREYSLKLGILNAAMEINGEAVRIKGVERNGALLGENEKGRIKKYYSGTLRWI